jgi:sugar lactone lactonase YvrE
MRILLLTILAISALVFAERIESQSTSIRIREQNPVVNENNQITLTAIDGSGNQVSDVSFESGSPDIAAVDPKTGIVRGMQRGFATVTARRGNESSSVFVAVARLESGRGARVSGDTKTDTGGRIYISDPSGNVILRKNGIATPPDIFAGQKGTNGRRDGKREDALFAGPTAVAVDNRSQGGIYIADTLNHSIRKVSFNDQVETIMGTGSAGINPSDTVPFTDVRLNGPRGVATDIGGNLLIVDTDNHAIYLADFEKKEMRLLAGEPGVSGKADGEGRSARFKNPSAIAVSNDGRSIAVADTGNRRCCLITRSGKVTSIGAASSSSGLTADQQTDGFEFNEPLSVSFDGVGNLYVVDKSGVQVVTGALGKTPHVVSLAQAGSFIEAVSVVLSGTQAFVLDNQAMSEDVAVKVVTFGDPQITSLSRDSDRLEGGTEVVISGKNFAPESLVVLGDRVVTEALVESATRIRLRVPAQNAPGRRTLSIQTRGGVAQREFRIMSKPLPELAKGEITTIAGGVSFLGDGGSAINAGLDLFLPGILSGRAAIDGAGNLFIPDTANNRVRRLNSSGVITTVAGNGVAGFSGDNGPAVNASLRSPTSVALDSAGNLFISDTDNNCIRRVDSRTGIIITVAGDGDFGFSGDGGPAISANLDSPFGITVDGVGNLFIADRDNQRVRRVDTVTGIITTVAGNGKVEFSGDGGPATMAGLFEPADVAVDEAGNLFVADSINNRIRRVDKKTATITTFAGNGRSDFSGDGEQAARASLALPLGIALDSKGRLYIADAFNNRIRLIDSTGIISTLAGNDSRDFGGDNGPAISASLNNPGGVVVDGVGNLFITDSRNNRVRRVDAVAKTITTISGNGNFVFGGDGGLAINAGLNIPSGITLDKTDNLFIADTKNNRIRRVDATSGIITTVVGNGDFTFDGDGGPADRAGINEPSDIVLDSMNNLFIADTSNHRIRRVDIATNIISTYAGDGEPDFQGDNGPAIKARLSEPFGVTIDTKGDLLIADRLNDRIRRVDAKTGIITTTAGNGSQRFSGDGGPAISAGLARPVDLIQDGTGNLLIADSINNRIRRVDAGTGVITTVSGGKTGGDGGPATEANLDLPVGVAIDGAGNLFIAEFLNNRVRRVDVKTGIITTVVGNGNLGFSGDNGLAVNAGLSGPSGVAIDAEGNLFIADSGNNAVRVVKGVGEGRSNITVIDASFSKSNLTINGLGFGLSGARVSVNARDISSSIVNQADGLITLKGNKKKLNLKRGPNQITVTVNGVSSNTFILNL